MEKNHIIFDLDGTLIDSKNEIINTYKNVFEEIKPPNSVNYNEINYGATLNSILEKIYINTELINEAKLKFAEIYDNSSYEDTLLYSNVKETLSELFENKYQLHIATNKRLIPTGRILKIKQLFHMFSSVVSTDSISNKILSKKEMVALICNENKITEGYMIGDSIQDIEAGNDLNLISVGVLYGYEKKEELLRKNPKFTIEKITELKNIIFQNYEQAK